MKIYNYVTMIGEDNLPFMKKVNGFNVDGRKKYTSPDVIVDFIKDGIGIQNCAEEYLYCLCLDTAGHMIGCFEVSHGTVNCSLGSPREIFQKALMLGAVSIIITHNHPSDDVTPSKADIDLTNKIKSAGDIIGIRLLDHIIVSRSYYYSFVENKLF